jgi:hypothetical protein
LAQATRHRRRRAAARPTGDPESRSRPAATDGTQGRPGSRLASAALAAILLVVGLSSCSIREAAIRGLADELASQGSAPESDLDLLREASAYHLKLSEAILREDPSHLALATAVTAGFTQYAYAFVAFEADRLESTDSRAAYRLRERAARLYRRAVGHGLAALELRRPGFRTALAVTAPSEVAAIGPDEIGLAYWTAAAWGAAIALSADHPDIVADLPLAARLAELAAEADPGFGDGALASLVANFAAATPGKGLPHALRWFDRAIELGASRSVGAYVAKAEGYALPRGDRAQFEALIDQALAVPADPDSPLALANEVMRRRAQWLLARIDELF